MCTSNVIGNKREFRAYNVYKQFSERLIDYLGPVMYKSLPLNIEKNIFDHST